MLQWFGNNQLMANPGRCQYIGCFARLGTICTIKNLKNTHGGVLLLVKLHALACSFAKSNTPSWEFFAFFKLYK